MHWPLAVLFPLTGALIGWLTNWLAVRLLFRPYRPVRIPLVGYCFQGMLPRYRFELAGNVGDLIEKELVQADSLLKLLCSDEMTAEMVQSLELAIRVRVMDKLPRWVPVSVKKILADAFAEQVQKQIPVLIGELTGRLGHRFKEEFKLARMVESRLNEFSLEHLEKIILSIAGRELRHIEFLGGAIGFIIGLVQAGLLFLID